MKIIADENCDRILVAALRSEGFDIAWVRDLAPSIDDTEIYDIATSEGRILLTNDQGFGLMAERMGSHRPPAIVLMRLERLPPALRTSTTVQAITALGEGLLGHFTVVEPHKIRSRPYKD